MDQDERDMLMRKIKELGLKGGKVLKSGGVWYIDGIECDIPAPRINLPHWSEGTKGHGTTIEGDWEER